jgi:hypothetical protein
MTPEKLCGIRQSCPQRLSGGTVGQQIEPFIRRDIAILKPPPGWSAAWMEAARHPAFGSTI